MCYLGLDVKINLFLHCLSIRVMNERVSNRQALSLGDLLNTFLRFHIKNQPLINFESWFTKYLVGKLLVPWQLMVILLTY